MNRATTYVVVHVLLVVLACAYVYECSSILRTAF